MRKISILVGIALIFVLTNSLYIFPENKPAPKDETLEETRGNFFCFDTATFWVDSVLQSLSLREKIGQLFVVGLSSAQGEESLKNVALLVEKFNIGGVIFMKGSPVRQARYTNFLQSKAKTPLLIAIDGEWGLAMRLDSIEPFPKQMMLGAADNEGLVYDMGVEIARQCRLMGIHINFAPVVDINNNPNNPVINYRSFGEDKNKVLRLSYAYMSGMQDQGLIVTAKHFPGHGDTEVDSHYGLPVITQSKQHLETNELYPFRNLIRMGLSGIMIAHMSVPALDSTTDLPATLSYPIVTKLLKENYRFNGLIFTDAMEMGGVTKQFTQDEAIIRAFKAGNDILLMPTDAAQALNRLEKAINSGEISMAELNSRVKKILAAKEKVGLKNYTPIELENLFNRLQNGNIEFLNHLFAALALTVLENKNNILPIENLTTQSLIISINGKENSAFFKRVASYNATCNLWYNDNLTENQENDILNTASKYPYAIVPWFGLSQFATKNYGVTKKSVNFLEKLTQKTNVILVVFGNPYMFSKNVNGKLFDAVVVAYEDNRYTQDYAAQLIFGGIESKGKLPVTTGPYKKGTGIRTSKTRLGFVHPKAVGASEDTLKKVDSIMTVAIRRGMTPGGQILCAKDGYVFYFKSFGFHTYDSITPVTENTIYDLASLTKILVTTPLLMHLYEKGTISMNDPIGKYITTSEILRDLKLIDILSHRSGLDGWISFYKNFMNQNNELLPEFFSNHLQNEFPIQISENLYTSPALVDSVFKIINQTPLKNPGEYVYSDLGYYLFMQMIESITYKGIDHLADSLFYQPLGITSLKYNPLRYFPKEEIAPSEIDPTFRKETIHGFVNDPGAAIIGGKCGHAGLFGTALDVAKMGQMFLDYGTYGNQQFFRKKTVEYFTTSHFASSKNRRGLGFDKPDRWTTKNSPTFEGISLKSFGHTGFTGTYLWMDPDSKILYVFLSNRTYPNSKNFLLVRNNIRTEIHKIFYNSFSKSPINKIKKASNEAKLDITPNNSKPQSAI